ncbi:MAG: DNA internalization-related competence protein ComEC/Rec2 [Dehalococcoidia bacterium]
MSARLPQPAPLVYLAGAWLLGVASGAVAGGVWWPVVAGLATAGTVAAMLERRPQLAMLGLLAAGLFVGGALRYVDQEPLDVPAGIALHNDGDAVRFRALVSDEPELRGRTQRVRLDVREALIDGRWEASSGGVLMRTRLFPRYEYGDLLELEGELETPPSFPDFDYRDYLARHGVVSLVAFPDEARTIATGEGERAVAALHSVRRELGSALAQALPEPQAALAQGIFLGQRSSIPAELTDDMNATGTSHLIAISGHNVSLVAALAIASLAWIIGRRQAALVALVAIAGYTVLTGASPTVVRAAIMGGLFVVATLAGRPGSAAAAIAFAAAVMTGWEPLVIEDISFQLSFAAIAGLVYLAPPFYARGVELLRGWGIEAGEGGVAGFLLESTTVTAAAVFATLPLFALYFDRVSIVTFAANLLLVPAFPLILGSSALTAISGALWAPLGDVSAWVSWAALTYMIEVARLFAAVPLASVDIDGFGRWHAAAAYVALGVLAVWLAQRPAIEKPETAGRITARPVVIRPMWMLAGALAVGAAIVWPAAFDDTGGRLTVSVLDVGQGDAILVETPDGRHVLVDGGADGLRLAEELGAELPFWERTLDLVALTHPQEDHMAGLVEALARYDVGRVLATSRENASATYLVWRDQIQRQGIPFEEARAGQQIDLGDGVMLRVLGPGESQLEAENVNDASLVLRLEWRDASFLLTGDIEASGEQALLRSGFDLGATVLKVPHHGSRTSSSTSFLSAVRPAIAVVSVGEDNPFGHPSPAVLDRLDGTLVLRTDEHGTVRLSTNGEKLWVETER